ncbi:MAG TPA: superoxide dismutase [Caulobacteraceae bacterium]|nr:superoxide dismutase [Caulobacteraceae bacterium]
MFPLPELPYAYDALSPTMSERTLHFHHDKHHAAYVKKTNELLQRAGQDAPALEDVIRRAKESREAKLFNNAAQAWNHALFWNCMTPEHQSPAGELASAIDKAFGGRPGFERYFVEEGAAHFGSGWVWLAADEGGALSIFPTHDADDTVARGGLTPLLVCDLWEHAYYLDYQNDRKAFLEAWLSKLANWRFAQAQFDAARSRRQSWRFPAAREMAAT